MEALEKMIAIRRLLRDQRGVSAIEYAFLAALIAMSIIISVGQVGSSLDEGLSEVESGFPDDDNGGKGKGKGKKDK